MGHSNEKAKLAANLQRQIHLLIKGHDVCDRVCLVQHGVTAAQGYALLALPLEGSATMNEISEALGIASSTMTRTIDPLVSKEMAYRAVDEVDRRIVRVGLTSQGLKIRKSIEGSLQDFFMMVLDRIEGEDKAAVLSSLEQVTTAFNKALEVCCPE